MTSARNPPPELIWCGKETRTPIAPAALIAEPAEDYGTFASPAPGEAAGISASRDNRLIHGDNRPAMQALAEEFAGRVRCAFVDPPYNKGAGFEHYGDGLAHATWLGTLRDQLALIHTLLADDGSLWITIDDTECHYLKVLTDEIFGRDNFIANVVWQKAYTSNQTARHFSHTHDHILVYAKDVNLFKLGKLPRTDSQKRAFKNRDGDPRGAWKPENLSAGKAYAAGRFPIVGPHGAVFLPPKGRYWRCDEEQFRAWLADGRITFGKAGAGRPMLKKFLAELKDELTANTWWTHEEAGHNKEASIHLKSLFGDQDVFQTPKPEKLLQRILSLATQPGDLVLDPFAGSGTTGAVAQKMGRRWIMIEVGEHCRTHVALRMRKVVDGHDPGGITSATGWRGGGGFRGFRVAGTG